MSGIINCATSMTVCARGTGLDAENLSGFSSQGELFLLTSFFIESYPGVRRDKTGML
jgi:hypothetical protein